MTSALLVVTGLMLQSPARTVTLRVGQGARLATGTVTKGRAGADVVFGVQGPQSTSGTRWRPGGMAYEVGITTRPAPMLVAAKVGTFDASPSASDLQRDPIDKWDDHRSDLGNGKFVVVRPLGGGRPYVLRILRLALPKDAPSTWRITLEYRPL